MNQDTKTIDVIDDVEMVMRLRVCGIRPVMDRGAIWIGRVCLGVDGSATVDGEPIAGLSVAVRSVAKTLPSSQVVTLRPGTKPKRGRQARDAVAELVKFAEEAGEEFQQLSPGRWLVGQRVLFSTTSGRVRAVSRRTQAGRGIGVLKDVLAETAKQHTLTIDASTRGQEWRWRSSAYRSGARRGGGSC